MHENGLEGALIIIIQNNKKLWIQNIIKQHKIV